MIDSARSSPAIVPTNIIVSIPELVILSKSHEDFLVYHWLCRTTEQLITTYAVLQLRHSRHCLDSSSDPNGIGISMALKCV